jgi:hypothetical protein
MAREHAKALRIHNDRLDEKREANYIKRQHRMHEASQMKMMEINEQIKVLNREEEVRKQRRSAAMHTFSLQRSQAYEVYMEKKRAREKLQGDEGAYDWLDLGAQEDEKKAPAAKAMEYAEAEAKQSKARAQLEEQRRRQKLNKQRQKIFDKMEKKRSAYEVERHEKFVEKKAGQVESEKATIADLVKAWRERAIAQKAEKATKANEMRRKKNLREDNIQRRLEENTTLP